MQQQQPRRFCYLKVRAECTHIFFLVARTRNTGRFTVPSSSLSLLTRVTNRPDFLNTIGRSKVGL